MNVNTQTATHKTGNGYVFLDISVQATSVQMIYLSGSNAKWNRKFKAKKGRELEKKSFPAYNLPSLYTKMQTCMTALLKDRSKMCTNKHFVLSVIFDKKKKKSCSLSNPQQ